MTEHLEQLVLVEKREILVKEVLLEMRESLVFLAPEVKLAVLELQAAMERLAVRVPQEPLEYLVLPEKPEIGERGEKEANKEILVPKEHLELLEQMVPLESLGLPEYLDLLDHLEILYATNFSC